VAHNGYLWLSSGNGQEQVSQQLANGFLGKNVHEAGPNKAVLVTAARWRIGMNVKGYVSGGGPRRQALASFTKVLSSMRLCIVPMKSNP
jgi:hypothetical protein